MTQQPDFSEIDFAKLMPVGRDPGFGNEAVCVGGEVATLQSVVTVPANIGRAAIGMKAGKGAMLVEWGDHRFYVGTGALSEGRPRTSLDYSDIASPERWALFYAALSKFLRPLDEGGKPKSIYLVIGLPVALLKDEKSTDAVWSALVKTGVGEHRFKVNGKEYAFIIPHKRCMTATAQPTGAFMDWYYNDTKLWKPRADGKDVEVAVFDTGFNTLDLFTVINSVVQKGYVGGAPLGVQRLFNIMGLNGTHDLVEWDAKLRTGKIKPNDRQLDMWLKDVGAMVNGVWPDLRRFPVIIPCGGGSLVMGDKLKEYLEGRALPGAVYWPENPLTTNVTGFWKLASKKRFSEMSKAGK